MPAHQHEELVKEANLIVSEVYSPPRVTKAAEMLKELDIDPGLALDLTTTNELGRPWDFSKDELKIKTRAKPRKTKA